jgi:O-antigen/teichoic acid export membrane protein
LNSVVEWAVLAWLATQFVAPPEPTMHGVMSRWSRLLASPGGFVQSVGILVAGTVAAHGITALALPVLTRLYSPGDFSVLAVFSGLLQTISVAACLRFDVAIALPERNADADNLLALAMACAAAVSAGLALVSFGVPEGAAIWLGQARLADYLWLLPIAVFLAGCHSALQFWFVREKSFRLIAGSRIAQSTASAGSQIGLGGLGFAPVGLILGQLVNSAVACATFGHALLTASRSRLAGVSWAGMRAMFVVHDRFPKFSTLEALTNSAAIQFPIIMIAAIGVGPEAGYLALAMQLMQAPMSLVGSAIGQVYLSRAADEYRAGRLGSLTAAVFGGLIKAGVGPLVFAGIVSPLVFGFIFGSEWQRAGILVSWMTPWFVMQLLVVPVSMALNVVGRQRTAFALQAFGLVLRLGMVYAVSQLSRAFVAEAYAISGFLFYFVYLVVVLGIAGSQARDVVRELRKGLPAVALWSLGGGGVVLGLDLLRPLFR